MGREHIPNPTKADRMAMENLRNHDDFYRTLAQVFEEKETTANDLIFQLGCTESEALDILAGQYEFTTYDLRLLGAALGVVFAITIKED